MSPKAQKYISLQVGEKTPEFELQNADGVSVALRDLLGKKIVLYFYPKDNTSGCTLEANEFSGLLGEFNKLGAIVVGVSPDSPKSHTNFITKHDLRHILLSDESHEMLTSYGVWGEKSMYGRKYFGVFRTTFSLDEEGKILQIWEKVKSSGHAKEVLEALKSVA